VRFIGTGSVRVGERCNSRRFKDTVMKRMTGVGDLYDREQKASASEEKLRRWLVAGRTSRNSSNVSLLSDSFQDCLGPVNRLLVIT